MLLLPFMMKIIYFEEDIMLVYMLVSFPISSLPFRSVYEYKNPYYTHHITMCTISLLRTYTFDVRSYV